MFTTGASLFASILTTWVPNGHVSGWLIPILLFSKILRSAFRPKAALHKNEETYGYV
jgi:hypothetical protein